MASSASNTSSINPLLISLASEPEGSLGEVRSRSSGRSSSQESLRSRLNLSKSSAKDTAKGLFSKIKRSIKSIGKVKSKCNPSSQVSSPLVRSASNSNVTLSKSPKSGLPSLSSQPVESEISVPKSLTTVPFSGTGGFRFARSGLPFVRPRNGSLTMRSPISSGIPSTRSASPVFISTRSNIFNSFNDSDSMAKVGVHTFKSGEPGSVELVEQPLKGLKTSQIVSGSGARSSISPFKPMRSRISNISNPRIDASLSGKDTDYDPFRYADSQAAFSSISNPDINDSLSGKSGPLIKKSQVMSELKSGPEFKSVRSGMKSAVVAKEQADLQNKMAQLNLQRQTSSQATRMSRRPTRYQEEQEQEKVMQIPVPRRQFGPMNGLPMVYPRDLSPLRFTPPNVRICLTPRRRTMPTSMERMIRTQAEYNSQRYPLAAGFREYTQVNGREQFPFHSWVNPGSGTAIYGGCTYFQRSYPGANVRGQDCAFVGVKREKSRERRRSPRSGSVSRTKSLSKRRGQASRGRKRRTPSKKTSRKKSTSRQRRTPSRQRSTSRRRKASHRQRRRRH